MRASRRKQRWWLALIGLALGWWSFSSGMLLSSPMWYDRCEGRSVFASLHCASPFLLLGAGAILLAVGGVLLLIEVFYFMRRL